MAHASSSDDEYVVLPVIPNEDEISHSVMSPFCSDPTCPCHEDPELIAEVATQVEEGLLTPAEATRLVAGEQL
ncbi:MAG TPA: hypothetical protein VFA41_14315 [Ktedonobacteraceae bacterium]|jgi:hypothetical protein|nr:hypothetical protein [Ktedonobacteraceae bacterium]